VAAFRRRPVQFAIAVGAAVLTLSVGAWAVLRDPDTKPTAGYAGPPTSPPTDPALPSDVPSDPPSATPVPTTPAPTPTPSAARPTRTPSPRPPAPPAPGQGQARNFFVTFYGARDNDPPGSLNIAYPVIHKQAGGKGTRADPITFATSKDELPIGTVIYYAPLKRYFIMEDQCVSCEQEFKKDRRPHIDLFAGASTNAGIIACEESLTPSGQVPVIVNPPSTLPVDTTPIYDGTKCIKP